MWRHVLGLVFPMTAILLSGSAAAQSTLYSCSGTTCTVPSGTYSSPADFGLTTSTNYTGTNLGQFIMNMPGAFNPGNTINSFILYGVDGSNSDDKDRRPGAGGVSGNVTYTNSGSYLGTGDSGFQFSDRTVRALQVRTYGGDGGDYTDSNGKQPAGSAGAGGAIFVTNNSSGSISFNTSGGGFIAPHVVGLLAQSEGGAGGFVANGNNTGTAGAAGGDVRVDNAATFRLLNVQFTKGFWGIGAWTIGGNGGLGDVGTAGGNARAATVNNQGDITLNGQWSAANVVSQDRAPIGIYGIYAGSQGGNGNQATNDDVSGGNGGSAGFVTVALDTSRTIDVTVATLAGAPGGIGGGVGAFSTGGNGAAVLNDATAGTGGAALPILVTLDRGFTIRTTGDQLAGIRAIATGGHGGSGSFDYDGSNGNRGGNVDLANNATETVKVALTGSFIYTNGTASPGIVAGSVGGNGGSGSDYDNAISFSADGGDGGNGGTSGAVKVSITSSTVKPSGAQSPAIIAYSQGGNGGDGGKLNAERGEAGTAGGGNLGRFVTVEIGSDAIILTEGGAAADGTSASHGVVASSIGGAGGLGKTAHTNFGADGGDGGRGGDTQGTLVTVVSNARVTTRGERAVGVVARSLSGPGGDGGEASGGLGSGNAGTAGSSGNSGPATISNDGQVETSGAYAHGLLVQSMSGVGGSGGQSSGVFYSSGGGAGASGTVGKVTVSNTGAGRITTSGEGAIGIQAQAIGGGSGTGGGSSGGFVQVGGSGSTSAAGGTVEINNAGSIATSGYNALGILGMSIGGGGGNGGDASGVIASIGGTGGGGGNGGSVSFNLTGGQVSTTGGLSHGAVVQSIGGGGGNGGDATSVGTVVTLAIGGSAEAGGGGGSVVVTGTGGAVTTRDTNAAGIVALSIGGGGGSGGSGYAATGGAGFSVSAAVGGSGGAGGSGGPVTVSLSNVAISTGLNAQDAPDPVTLPDDTAITALPVDSYGLVALSVGAGGGYGGSATAKSYTVDVPVPNRPFSAAISGSFSMGGDGGVGGDGQAVIVDLPFGSSVATNGNGSHAIVGASVGGGGGMGGDSSALAAAFGFKNASKAYNQANYNVEVAISLGGQGGAAGNGGPVTVTLGGTNGVGASGSPVVIQTLGDYAYGVAALSVGGGGGNAGSGAGSTQNGTSSKTALKFSASVGAQGGGGGDGKAVTIYSLPGTSIQTAGDTAYGIRAASVGGGGGDSTGGSYQLGLPSLKEIDKVVKGVIDGSIPGVDSLPQELKGVNSTITIKAGTQGGTGGVGGDTKITIDGSTIATTGEAGTAVFAQSVGGGGGAAGSAGSTGSSDNPTVIDAGKAVKKYADVLSAYILEVAKAVQENKSYGSLLRDPLSALFPSLSINLSFGATGGAGGDGGVVTTDVTGSVITTQGDYARAVMAQSVGGGGGVGGAAVAGGSQGMGNILKVNLNYALGGNGGAGGDGKSVTIGLADSHLLTTGYAAYGVFGQSIGGGGGDVGSAQTVAGGVFSLGRSASSGTSLGADGGEVKLIQRGGGLSRVTTGGDTAHAIVLQSIGGGGGVAGTGFSNMANIGGFELGSSEPTPNQSRRVGAGLSGGNGGRVSFDTGAPPKLAIATTGANAFGVFAQSVGGGGGLTFDGPGAVATRTMGGASTGDYANGGTVSLYINDGSSIHTRGDGAIGIFAQSVGGGGGVNGYATGAASIQKATGNDGSGFVTRGNAGEVIIDTGSIYVTTSGKAAHGIFAQSVGAGGGVKASADGSALIAGSAGASGSFGAGGGVTIFQDGALEATGDQSIGIFAQSIGQNGSALSTSDTVTVQVRGGVIGGTGSQGWGIWADSDYGDAVIAVYSGGYVSSGAQQAVRYTGQGPAGLYIYGGGTVVGMVDLEAGGGTGTVTIEDGGTLTPSVAVGASVVNAGRIAPSASNAFAPITITGRFSQSATGVFAPNVNFSTRQADSLVILGDAVLGGQVLPVVASALLPSIPVPVLTVRGNASGELSGGASTLYRYGVSRTGNQYFVAATGADFTPVSISLNGAQSAVAEHLQAAWDRGGSPGLASLFATLGGAADAGGGTYASALTSLSPNATLAPGSRGVAGAQAFANNTLSCPTFEGTTAMLVERPCTWLRVTGRTASQSSGNGVSSFRYDTITWQIGGQTELAPGWLVGGSLAYEDSSLSSGDKSSSGRGQSGYGALTLKYQTGPWLFSGSLFGGAGEFNASRIVSLPGFGAIAKSSPDTSNVGMLLRAAYTFGQENFYVRPTLNLSLVRVGVGGYQESGAGALSLSVDGASQTTAIASPMLEFGGRVALGDDMVLRPFFAAGLSLRSTNSWTQTARLSGAPPGSAGFKTSMPIAPVQGRVAAGVQLYTADRIDLRMQYDGDYSASTTAHAGSLVVSLRF